MHHCFRPIGRLLCMGWLMLVLQASAQTTADARSLAPGFTGLPKGTDVVVMQPDIELFSMSGGGVQEPRADWTEAAQRHVHAALRDKASALGVRLREVGDRDADELAEINALHAAVAQSIALHHARGGALALPTKEGKLDWSLGEAVVPIRNKTRGDYALFLWVRDSYASAERKLAMVALALFGVGVVGGFQVGYASLVDLKTGQVLWFNQLVRSSGDLREAIPAAESVGMLLKNFPPAQ